VAALPKAELHLHLEGSIEPSTAAELAARHGDSISATEVAARYATRDFSAFIEAYKWVTSYLRDPQDYALVAREAAEQLLAQNVLYAEITLSVGVMLFRQQDVTAIFRAILEAVRHFVLISLAFGIAVRESKVVVDPSASPWTGGGADNNDLLYALRRTRRGAGRRGGVGFARKPCRQRRRSS